MQATKDFFVSYTSADKSWAEWLTWTLEQAGYTCILQAWDFVPGQDFMQQMRDALNRSAQVIAVLSSDYFQSIYAAAELNAALVSDPLGNKGKLVPVRIRDCELGGMLRGRIYIDLVGKNVEQARRDLIAGVEAARLGRRADPEEARFLKPPRFPGNLEAAPHAELSPQLNVSEGMNVLFIGSDAGAGLDLKGQFDQIGKILKKARPRLRFELNSAFDVTTENIFEVLNKYRPNIVHFSGKQNGGNVLILKPSGGVTTVSDRALAGLLQSIDSNVILAIIDTCKSLRCARTVASTLGFAMGVAGDIYDADAIHYYNVFYGALAAGKSLASASGQAVAALEFKGVPSAEIPQLCCQPAADPKSLRFVSNCK